MKANEAPKKIYRTTTYLDNDRGKTLWKKAPVAGAENIEYIRTDAFIENACEYLQINLWRVVNEEHDFRQRFVTDFKNYMKGE